MQKRAGLRQIPLQVQTRRSRPRFAHLTEYIQSQLDRVGLPHTTCTEEAITRSAQGTLRAVKNLCIGSLIEAVRDRTKTVDLKQVNAVLLQPHWRHNQTGELTEPILIPPSNLPTGP